MVVHKIPFCDAETYYFKTMFDNYDNFCDFFKKTNVYKNTPSENMFKKIKKDKATKKVFKTYYNKGLLDEYYINYDCDISDEEEVKVEEVKVEEVKKIVTYIKVDGVSKIVELDKENHKKLKEKEKKEEEVKFVEIEDVKVIEEEEGDTDTLSLPEEEIDMNYVSNNVIDDDYDHNLLFTEQPKTKKQMTIQCDMIVRSIVEDAIKNGKEVKSINDDEMKECENCCNYEMDCMLFEDKYYMCKECYDDIDVGRFYMKRYFELQEQIYDVSKKKLEGMKKENKIVKITDKGKKKTKYKKAKCNGHNPTKSNDDKFNELMCKCRIWNEGYGGQCQSKPSGEEDMCKTHFKKVKKLREEWSDTLGWWFGYYNEDRCDSLEELFPNDEVCDYIDFLPKTVRSGAVSRGNSGGSDFKWK